MIFIWKEKIIEDMGSINLWKLKSGTEVIVQYTKKEASKKNKPHETFKFRKDIPVNTNDWLVVIFLLCKNVYISHGAISLNTEEYI